MSDDNEPSSYLRYLPAIFHAEPFVGRFLRAFEAVLSGLPDGGRRGFEETIATVHTYFDPQQTDEEFLPWLANWVALSLRADWEPATKREFIRQVVPLYKLRGTKAGLQRMLEIYTGQKVIIYAEFEQPAHFFQVSLTLPESDPLLLQRKQQIARAIIEQEKPAHTFFALQIAIPTMRLVSLALREREGDKTKLLILSGAKTKGNTVLGTTAPS